MNKPIPALLLFSVIFTFPVLIYSEAGSPGWIVKDTVDQILVVLDDPALNEEQKRRSVYQLAREHIDFTGMSQRILATEWGKASDEQKIEFISLFEKILMNDYWMRIRNYSGERIEYLAVSVEQEKYATVDTIILRDGDQPEIPITYRMENKDGRWQAHDFLVESLSLVQNYQREYQAIIKKKGITGLLEHMKHQIPSS